MPANCHSRQKRRRSEQAYVMEAHRRLRRLGIPCKWEAALLGRSVDLVFFHEEAVCSVEFKTKDWRRGLKQARDHQLAADYAYICLIGQRLTDTVRREADQMGIGLLLYREDSDWPFDTDLAAKQSTIQWHVARNRLLKKMNAHSNE